MNKIYEAIAEATPAIVWVMDVRTNQYVYLNSAITRLLGHPVSTFMEQGAAFTLSIMHPEDLERVMNKHNSKLEDVNSTGVSAQEGYTHVDEYRLRHLNGSWRWMRSSAIVFERDEKDQVKSVLGVAQDITGYKDLESRLIVSDRMASVGRLAAGVAHEINNPLSHLLGTLELTAERLAASGASEKIASSISACLRSANRISSIVSDLNSFAHPRDNEYGPTDLRAAIETALPIAMTTIKHRARLVQDYKPVGPVHGNESRLCQIFLNLLMNAAEALPLGQAEENEIRISTYATPEGRIVAEIGDTGPGIPSQALGSLFDPFYTTKAVGEGTGLGLYICYNIVKSLGGEIQVKSELGKGSVFRVILNASQEPAKRANLAVDLTRPISARRGHVLIVDDDAMVAALLKETLEHDHSVTIAANGHEALQALAASEDAFDLILCDLIMPNMSGIELYRQLSKIHAALAKNVVFVTGGALSATADEFLRGVPNQVISKPFRTNAIRALVKTIVERENK